MTAATATAEIRPSPDGPVPHDLRRAEVAVRGVPGPDGGPVVMAHREWRGPDGAGRPPAVLVHGMVVSSRYHVPLAERLAATRRVLAPDLPGYGESHDGAPDDLDTRALGRALAAWLDACGLAGVDLVANSYGCQVVAEALLARPELARRLVLLGPTIDRRARRLDEQLRRWNLESKTQTPALKRLLVRDYMTAGVRRAEATLRHALQDVIEDKLPWLDVPTLVVRGTRDPIVPQRWAQEVADLLPQGRLVVLPGATHAVNHEQPLQTARVVTRFLDD
jgi:2-hydroxy-6-oxonona-2,4-dienedioate hydrolase